MFTTGSFSEGDRESKPLSFRRLGAAITMASTFLALFLMKNNVKQLCIPMNYYECYKLREEDSIVSGKRFFYYIVFLAIKAKGLWTNA